jgi:hypothetical protein
MFLVGYVVFQLPGTLLIKKLQAPKQFSAAMMSVCYSVQKKILDDGS